MVHHTSSAGSEITAYFNSPAFNAPKESELLAAIMTELMRYGRPATNKALIASVIKRLEGEPDEARLQGYRNLLKLLLEESEP
ncbi:biofilm development regulator YmgB/AriR family protein [Kalamiella sp. sgz302252]|uniref:biofilm development regulator YmgB/AriR family protein n=1 Tax=Pantoea sp. sgz302252 TaxID=3341827 RepID=UPI0036D28A12